MQYEATVHFEVNDPDMDVADLMRSAWQIGIHSVGLIGRTDEGELAQEMEIGRIGQVEWTPEAKVKIAEATKEISRRLEVHEGDADRLWEAMSDVYELMARHGLCAYPGGEQSVRVIPEALEFIQARAAAMPEGED